MLLGIHAIVHMQANVCVLGYFLSHDYKNGREVLFVWEEPLTTHVFAAIEACTGEIKKKALLSHNWAIDWPIDWTKVITCFSRFTWCVLPLGFRNWMTTSSLKMLTSSMAGMAFTPILFKVLWSLLSSVVVVLWTVFFFLAEQLNRIKMKSRKIINHYPNSQNILFFLNIKSGSIICPNINLTIPIKSSWPMLKRLQNWRHQWISN